MDGSQKRYLVVISEGGMVQKVEEPEGIEFVYIDYEDLEYNDPDMRGMAGFERCASCSHARDLHREDRCVLEGAACSGWEPTGVLIDGRSMTDLEGYESEEAT